MAPFSYAFKPRLAPPKAPECMKNGRNTDPVSESSGESRIVVCQLGESPTKEVVAPPEPHTTTRKPAAAPVQQRRVQSPSRGYITPKPSARKAQLGPTGPLRREAIKRLIDDTRPKPGSFFREWTAASDDDSRAFLYCYEAACITHVPLKPLRMREGAAHAAASRSSGMPRRNGTISVADVALAKRRRSSSNTPDASLPARLAISTAAPKTPGKSAARLENESCKWNVVGENNRPAKNVDVRDPANHSPLPNMSRLASKDNNRGNGSRPFNSDYALDRFSTDLSFPSPSICTASSSPDSTPPLTPTDLGFTRPTIVDTHDEFRHRLHKSGGVTDVDVGGAKSATH